MKQPHVLSFGQHAGKTLAAVPAPYLFFLLTRWPRRRHKPDTVAAVLEELSCRLMVDFDGVLAELLAPVPVEAIAAARIKKQAARKAKLARLLAQRDKELDAAAAFRQSVHVSLAKTPRGRELLRKKGLLP